MYPSIEIASQHNIDKDPYTGKNIRIAVMDYSFNVEHPAIRHSFSDPQYWYDSFNDCEGNHSSFFYDNKADHGNHTVGLISGIVPTTNQPLGLASEATIIPVCAMNSMDNFGKKREAYLRGLHYITQLDCEIVNISQELLFEEEVLSLLFKLVQQGKIIVYAAGNHSHCLNETVASVLQHPMLRKGLITVGSLSSQYSPSVGTKIGYNGSNYVSDYFTGNFIWVRGENRYSASGNSYTTLSGTSMAAPTLTGAIACLWQKNPTLTNEELVKIVVGSCSKAGAFAKLNFTKMLTADIQEKILKEAKQPPIDDKVQQELLPDFFIRSSEIKTIAGGNNKFIFRKLTIQEVIFYSHTDFLFLKEKEKILFLQAENYVYCGLFQIMDGAEILVMPVAAFNINNQLMFLSGECVYLFSHRNVLFNELAYYLAQQEALKCFESIYSNWGSEFSSSTRYGTKFYNLKEPKRYFDYIHAEMKQEDLFPQVEIERMEDDSFLELSKVENKILYDMLLNNPIKENFLFATSPNYHLYLVKTTANIFHIEAFRKDNQIILKLPTIDNWFRWSALLYLFQQKVEHLGLRVYAAYYEKILPFYSVDIGKLQLGKDSKRYNNYILYELDKIDISAKVGLNDTPIFLKAIREGHISAVKFCLDHEVDINTCDQRGDNGLHMAIYARNMDLIRTLVAAEINIHQRNSRGLKPLRLAEQLKFEEAFGYLRSIMPGKVEERPQEKKLKSFG